MDRPGRHGGNPARCIKLGHDSDAEAARPPPYPSPVEGEAIYLWVTATGVPIGLFSVPDPYPGVESVEVPSNRATRFARSAFSWANELEQVIPGSGDLYRWIMPGTVQPGVEFYSGSGLPVVEGGEW